MNRSRPIVQLWKWFIAAAAIALVIVLTVQLAAAQEVTTDTSEIGGIPTNILMWGTVIGFLGSPFISALNRQKWSSEVKALSAFVWCFVGALGTVYFSDNFDVQNLATTFLFTFVTAISSYEKFWKPTGIAGKIERATG